MEGSFDAVTALLRRGADINSVRAHVIIEVECSISSMVDISAAFRRWQLYGRQQPEAALTQHNSLIHWISIKISDQPLSHNLF